MSNNLGQFVSGMFIMVSGILLVFGRVDLGIYVAVLAVWIQTYPEK